MADHSKIEWTETTPLRVRAAAVARIGVTVGEYDARLEAGEKWCCGCRSWQPRSDFAADKSRGDGLVKWCRAYANERSRASYIPKPRPASGRRFVEPRDDDFRQARRRVNHLVAIGRLPAANTVPCSDCGHVWAEEERRHEYDHYLGYGAKHHEDVQAVCTMCHHARENERRSA